MGRRDARAEAALDDPGRGEGAPGGLWRHRADRGQRPRGAQVPRHPHRARREALGLSHQRQQAVHQQWQQGGPRYRLRRQNKAPDRPDIAFRQVRDLFDMFFGNDQYVNRCLRVYILKGQHLRILKNDF